MSRTSCKSPHQKEKCSLCRDYARFVCRGQQSRNNLPERQSRQRNIFHHQECPRLQSVQSKQDRSEVGIRRMKPVINYEVKLNRINRLSEPGERSRISLVNEERGDSLLGEKDPSIHIRTNYPGLREKFSECTQGCPRLPVYSHVGNDI